MEETKQTGGVMTIYSVASEITTLPLIEPVRQARFRAQPPERKARQQHKGDTVTLSSEALQLSREGAAAEED
jgi:hypothetical protein